MIIREFRKKTGSLSTKMNNISEYSHLYPMNMQPDWMRGVFGVDRGGKICYSIGVRGGSAGDERRGYGGIGRRAGFR